MSQTQVSNTFPKDYRLSREEHLLLLLQAANRRIEALEGSLSAIQDEIEAQHVAALADLVPVRDERAAHLSAAAMGAGGNHD